MSLTIRTMLGGAAAVWLLQTLLHLAAEVAR